MGLSYWLGWGVFGLTRGGHLGQLMYLSIIGFLSLVFFYSFPFLHVWILSRDGGFLYLDCCLGGLAAL